MKKLIILLVFIICACSIVRAQTLSPQATPTSGGHSAAGGTSLSFTIGQTFNPSLVSAKNQLSQGFQQPEIEIITGIITGQLHACDTVKIPFRPYSILSGSNVFAAQLSSASGSFDTVTAIGTLTGNMGDTIVAVIPCNIHAGSAYRIRAVTSQPVYNGTDNGSALVINARATSSTTPVTICPSALPYKWNGVDYNTAGNYTIHLTNTLGGDSAATLVLTVTPAITSATLAANNPQACFGAKRGIVITTTGGTAPYQYSIDGGANWQSAKSFSVIAGAYTAMVKDAAGCSLTTNSVAVNQPAAKLSVTSAIQTNNTIVVTAADGYGGYLFNLNSSAYQASNVLTGYHAGADTIHVKDAAGCTAKKYVNTLTATATPENNDTVVCGGKKRKIFTTVKGGKEPFVYSIDGVNYQANKIFGVDAGSYNITVKDANNNTFTTSAITITTQALPVAIATGRHNVSCLGGNDGIITVTPANGGVYTYRIGNGAYTSTGTFTGLAAGKYTIWAKDANGCTAGKSITVTEPLTPCALLSSGGDNNPAGNTAEMHDSLVIKVLPNPAQVEFNLQIISGDSKYNVELRVMDLNGKVIYHTNGSVFDSYRFGRMFAGGMYIAEVLNGKNVERVKLIKGN